MEATVAAASAREMAVAAEAEEGRFAGANAGGLAGTDDVLAGVEAQNVSAS
jgi:hypothetical protein